MAPSNLRLLIVSFPLPSMTRDAFLPILTCSGVGKTSLYSAGQSMADGLTTTSGPSTTLMPLYSSSSPSSTWTPMDLRILRKELYWSASPVAAHAAGVPLAWSLTPSSVAFLTGEKAKSAAIEVKPTKSECLDSRTVGKSYTKTRHQCGRRETQQQRQQQE